MDARSIPEEIFQPLCTAVGQIVVNWSFVEQSLNIWIITIYQAAGGKDIERVIPQSLNRKIKFLRKCFRQIQALVSFKDEGLDFITRAKELSTVRHFVVHGTISTYEETDHMLTFVKLDIVDDGTIHKTNELRITARKLVSDGDECHWLAHAMLGFGQRLNDQFVPD